MLKIAQLGFFFVGERGGVDFCCIVAFFKTYICLNRPQPINRKGAMGADKAVCYLETVCAVTDGNDLALLGSADQPERAAPKKWNVCKPKHQLIDFV